MEQFDFTYKLKLQWFSEVIKHTVKSNQSGIITQCSIHACQEHITLWLIIHNDSTLRHWIFECLSMKSELLLPKEIRIYTDESVPLVQCRAIIILNMIKVTVDNVDWLQHWLNEILNDRKYVYSKIRLNWIMMKLKFIRLSSFTYDMQTTHCKAMHIIIPLYPQYWSIIGVVFCIQFVNDPQY